MSRHLLSFRSTSVLCVRRPFRSDRTFRLTGHSERSQISSNQWTTEWCWEKTRKEGKVDGEPSFKSLKRNFQNLRWKKILKIWVSQTVDNINVIKQHSLVVFLIWKPLRSSCRWGKINKQKFTGQTWLQDLTSQVMSQATGNVWFSRLSHGTTHKITWVHGTKQPSVTQQVRVWTEPNPG